MIVIPIIYVVTLPPDKSEPVLSVQTMLANTNLYLNRNITVEGIYYVEDDNEYLTPPDANPANPIPTQLLQINTENLDNTTILIQQSKYHLTGRLETVTSTGGIALVVASVEPR